MSISIAEHTKNSRTLHEWSNDSVVFWAGRVRLRLYVCVCDTQACDTVCLSVSRVLSAAIDLNDVSLLECLLRDFIFHKLTNFFFSREDSFWGFGNGLLIRYLSIFLLFYTVCLAVSELLVACRSIFKTQTTHNKLSRTSPVLRKGIQLLLL